MLTNEVFPSIGDTLIFAIDENPVGVSTVDVSKLGKGAYLYQVLKKIALPKL